MLALARRVGDARRLVETLTQRQADVLDFIAERLTEDGRTPSLREIAAEFDIAHQSAHQHVNMLVEKGYLHRVEREHRALDLGEEGYRRRLAQVERRLGVRSGAAQQTGGARSALLVRRALQQLPDEMRDQVIEFARAGR